MATAVTGAKPSALQLLEDAVRLLRAAPFDTLVWHWAGSLPMAVGAVYFWNEITHPNITGSRLALDALALSLLLAWLNLCRAVYASRLREQLAGASASPAAIRELWRMAGAQTLLGSLKMIVLPLAFVSTILLSPAVAFFRNAAALAAREPDTGPLVAKARRYARHEAAQGWRALGLLISLYPLALFNVVLTLAILPQLARLLTGYESAYSRMGARLLEDSLFWTLAFALTWLLLDPFVQAVYCVRCFQAESAETGEDVKAVMRRLRRGAVAAAVIVLGFSVTSVARAQSAPEPELQRAVEQAAQSPEYDWRIEPQVTERRQPSWFVAATARIVAATRAFLRSLSDAIDRLLRWIFGRAENAGRGGNAPVGTLPAGIWILIVLALAAAAFALLRARYTTARKASAGISAARAATSQDAEDMDPLRFPEQTWIELAERALAAHDFRLAMRSFYLASLGWLGRREFLQIHSGKTNREYERELRRRARAAPEARDLFARNVAAFERSWYGMHEIGGDDVERFRAQMTEMQQRLEAAS
jgi:hypothetical protein